MNKQSKLVLGVMILVAAGVVVDTARAGNAVVAGAELFSVDVPAGFEARYVGPNPQNATLLVDDITYIATIDPCEVEARCAYFPRGVMAPFYTPAMGGTDPNATNTPPFNVYIYSEARGTDFVVGVFEIDINSLAQEFDCMSHSTHSEFHAVTTVAATDSVVTETTGGIDIATGNWVSATTTTSSNPALLDPENLLDWELMGVTMTSWATPTSQSRHYQTPQVIQPMHTIEVRLTNLGSGTYGNARAKIKGRVILELNDAPAESTALVVSTP